VNIKWAFLKAMLGLKAKGPYTLDDMAADGLGLTDKLLSALICSGLLSPAALPFMAVQGRISPARFCITPITVSLKLIIIAHQTSARPTVFKTSLKDT
jgi:hypothetical protein